MRTLLITVVWGVFLCWIYSRSHSTAILAGLTGWALILAEGNLHFARVRRNARR